MKTEILIALIFMGAEIGSITSNDSPVIFTHVELLDNGPPAHYHRFTISCAYSWVRWLWGDVDHVTGECISEDWIRCDVDPNLPHDPAFFPSHGVLTQDNHGSFRIEVVQCIAPPYRVPLYQSGFE